jgi:hypothetical protein
MRYVILIKWLQSGFNTYFTALPSRGGFWEQAPWGIKPLSMHRLV